MKILVLLGSPHKNGTTATLAESFCEGAEAAGHSVDKVHIPRLKVALCMGCNTCQSAKKTIVMIGQWMESLLIMRIYAVICIGKIAGKCWHLDVEQQKASKIRRMQKKRIGWETYFSMYAGYFSQTESIFMNNI